MSGARDPKRLVAEVLLAEKAERKGAGVPVKKKLFPNKTPVRGRNQ